MKKAWIYNLAAACVALSTLACSKEEALPADYAAGEGGVAMHLAQTRAVDVSGLTLDDCTVFVYERSTDAETGEPAETLIRKYAPTDCPAVIKLLAGDYAVKVQWGEQPDAAAFDRCFYEGKSDFTVTAGRTEQVTVACKPQCAVVEVTFAPTIAASLTDYLAEFALRDSDAPVTALTFVQSDTGYFTVAEGGEAIRWSFSAVHPEKGPLRKQGEIAAEAGKRYAVTFRYSPDLPGYITVDLEINDSTDDRKDVLVFSEDPEVNGAIFSEPLDYTADDLPETLTVTMTATGDAVVQAATIYLSEGAGGVVQMRAEGDNEAILWRWPEDAADESKVKARLSDDQKELTVTVSSKAFLSNDTGEIAGGRRDLRFEVEDNCGGRVDKTSTIRIEGFCPVGARDYDLWTNDLTLRAVSAKGAPTFRMRIADDGAEPQPWQTVTCEQIEENEYEATLTDEAKWTPSENTKVGVTVYRPKQGIYANHRYEFEVEIDGKTYRQTLDTACDQPIPYGDMADGSLSCFTTSNENAPFWGSGNNSFAGDLCRQATKSGLPCARLKSTMAGMLGINMLASGNLFTGTFVRPSTTGTVSFGRDYDWQARPTALHIKYHATIGQVNAQKHKKDGSHPLNKGDQDISVIYVAIVDWNQPHKVASGTSDPSGMWSPDETTNPGEGAVIGYGIVRLTKSTEGDDLDDLEIPIYYYDRIAKPSKAYKLVISASTCYYGDYMCGCDSNELWLTDFKWVY